MTKCPEANGFLTPSLRHAWTAIKRLRLEVDKSCTVLVRYCRNCGENQIGTAIPKRERDQFIMMEGRS